MKFSRVGAPAFQYHESSDSSAWFPLGEDPSQPEAWAFFCADGGATSDPSIQTAKLAEHVYCDTLKETWAWSVHASSSDRVRAVLHSTLTRVNRRIFSQAMTGASIQERYVCMAAGIIHRGVLTVANAGTVGVLLWRDDEFRRLTREHSFSASLAERGLVHRRAALRHPFSQVAGKALGRSRELKATCCTLPLEKWDTIITLTDGFADLRSGRAMQRWYAYHLEQEGDMEDVFAEEIAQEKRLSWLSNRFQHAIEKERAPLQDDATALVIQIEPRDAESGLYSSSDPKPITRRSVTSEQQSAHNRNAARDPNATDAGADGEAAKATQKM